MERAENVRQKTDGELAEMQADLRNLITSLQDHRININSKLGDLDSKFESMRRDQTKSIDELEDKLMNLFVLRAEYLPKHDVILDKIKEYDQIISDARKRQEEYTTYRSRVAQLETEFEQFRAHTAGWAGRLLPWIAVVVSTAAVLLNYAQHITIR